MPFRIHFVFSSEGKRTRFFRIKAKTRQLSLSAALHLVKHSYFVKDVTPCVYFSHKFSVAQSSECPSEGKSHLGMKTLSISNSSPTSCFPGQLPGSSFGDAVHLPGDGNQTPEEQDASGEIDGSGEKEQSAEK